MFLKKLKYLIYGLTDFNILKVKLLIFIKYLCCGRSCIDMIVIVGYR